MRRSGPTRRDARRPRLRSCFACLRACVGFSIISPFERTARCLTPTSTPTTTPQSPTAAEIPVVAGGSARAGRAISTENDTCHRPRRNERVADRIRAVPAIVFRANLRVDSADRTTPIRGSWMWRRSPLSVTNPKLPVVNRHDSTARLPLKRGNPIGPLRFPDRASDQFDRAAAQFASPEL